ncbi:MAG: hypothetical protein LUD69_07880 [Oscillospiraceae bacterium]|nr:hypothetical protein [Oscillospiraceae bacterium]
MKKFIYVFDRADRDALLDAGYRMMRADEKGQVYIFQNTESLNFDLSAVDMVWSDVLSF